MSVFVHAQGKKTVQTEGGKKMANNNNTNRWSSFSVFDVWLSKKGLVANMYLIHISDGETEKFKSEKMVFKSRGLKIYSCV